VAATFNGRGSQIKERELEMALETALRALGREPKRQLSIKLEDAWAGRVGGVDLALDSPDGLILIELKWDPITLAACAWDSIKLAAALQAKRGQRGFLIAGAPISEGMPGNELLNDREVEPLDLRRRYATDFDRWKADVKNHPRHAPTKWRTRLRHSECLEFKGVPWRIRLTEIELTDSDLTPFE